MTIYELLLEEYIKDLEQQIRMLESDINLRKAMDEWTERQEALRKQLTQPQFQPWISPFPSPSKCAVCGMELKNHFACGNAMCPQQLRFVD